MDKLTDSVVDNSSLESAEFTEYKKTLPQEPSGDVKKIYSIACHSGKDWTSVHKELVKDGSGDVHVPTEVVACIDNKQHSKTRGSYKLTDTEAAELAKDSRVKCINVDVSSYPGTYAIDPLQIMDAIVQVPRYSNTVKNLRGYAPPSSPTAADKNLAGYQLLRSKQKTNAWGGSVPGTLNDRLASYGDGSDVDLIVGDQACWFGHIEFQNDQPDNPTNYVGGNVLPGNGTCDLLDVILDAPYYIDPAWFNADPSNILTTRWDGTVVPVEQNARAWWSDPTKRSVQFANIGTVSIPSYYDRARSNGSNSNNHSSGSGDYHGTPCASQAYGRQYGFAYNANKWYINAYGTYGCGFEQYFDVMKLFHLHKPVNPTYGSKDPTISSNSWGYRKTLPNSGYYFHRKGLTGTISTGYSIGVTAAGASAYTLSGTDKSGSVSGNNPTISCNDGDVLTFSVSAGGHPFYIKTQAGTGAGNLAPGVVNQGATNGDVVFTPQSDGTYYYQCQYHSGMVGTITVTTGTSAGVQWNSGTVPAFLSYFTQDAIRFEYIDNPMSIAGDELIDSGVIFICSSGNTNQKLVKGDHPDYDNYWGTSPNTGYPNAFVVYGGYAAYNSINRNGFPGQIGKQGSGSSTVYRTINVGAMSDFLHSTSGSGVEKKVNYSNMGNLIPYYAPAANTLAACDDSTSTQYNRYDTYYTLNGQQSHPSYDCLFGGTSSACPVSAGLIATKVQYNRNWDYTDILNWVTTSVGTQAAGDMVVGNDSSSPTATGTGEWSDNTSLQGGQPIIIWDAPTGNEPGAEDTKIRLNITNASGLNISGVNIINT
tara:strand:+ start:320 stop:2773 length:2454 start_codon:yes stop_codon:yes gene_type:complete